MALMRVSKELITMRDIFIPLIESFDFVEEVDNQPGVIVFRVYHEDVPKEDVTICPEMMKFEGVQPFIISFDA